MPSADLSDKLAAANTDPNSVGLQPNYDDESKLRFGKWARDALRRDMNLLTKRPWDLGISQQEKEKAIDNATQQEKGVVAQQQQLLAQQALGGNAIQAGALTQASQDLNKSVGNAAAVASANITKLNNDLINARRGEILGRVENERAINRERTQQIISLTSKILASIGAGIATGGAGLPALGTSLSALDGNQE